MPAQNPQLNVLCSYHDRMATGEVIPLGTSGGMSGAQFWRVRSPSGEYCLRQWPNHGMTQSQLDFILAALWFARKEGFSFIPHLMETVDHSFYVNAYHHIWSYESWVPGESLSELLDRGEDISYPLEIAMHTLGQFHQTLRLFPIPVSTGLSTSVIRHMRRVHSWRHHRFTQMYKKLHYKHIRIQELATSLAEAVQPRLKEAARLLESTCEQFIDLMPCWGDLHTEHVQYPDQHKTICSFIDTGSLHVDSASVDIGALLGSATSVHSALWDRGIQAYQTQRNLTDRELRMAEICAETYPVTSTLSWLESACFQPFSTSYSLDTWKRVEARARRLLRKLNVS